MKKMLESLACLGSFYILDGYIQELEKVLGKSRTCDYGGLAFTALLYNAKGYFAIPFFLSSQLKSQTE
jgi:hypothetical protein